MLRAALIATALLSASASTQSLEEAGGACTGERIDNEYLEFMRSGRFCMIPVLPEDSNLVLDLIENCCEGESRVGGVSPETADMFSCSRTCIVKDDPDASVDERHKMSDDFEKCVEKQYPSKGQLPGLGCTGGLGPASVGGEDDGSGRIRCGKDGCERVDGTNDEDEDDVRDEDEHEELEKDHDGKKDDQEDDEAKDSDKKDTDGEEGDDQDRGDQESDKKQSDEEDDNDSNDNGNGSDGNDDPQSEDNDGGDDRDGDEGDGSRTLTSLASAGYIGAAIAMWHVV